MKNKKLTYLMLPLVLLIWGLIFYRIFFKPDETEDNIPLRARPVIEDSLQTENTVIHLQINYADPFLKNVYKEKSTEPSKQVFDPKPQRPVQKMSRRRSPWPEIIYNGIISDTTKKRLGLIDINKKNILVNEGLTIQKVNIYKLFRDSVILIFEGDTLTYNKHAITNKNER